jgi:hypothetical protein
MKFNKELFIKDSVVALSMLLLTIIGCDKKSDELLTAGGQATSELSNVFLHQIQLTQGEAANLNYSFLSSSASSKVSGTANSLTNQVDLEFMLLDPNGVEVLYNRDQTLGGFLESFTPSTTGNYTVLIRDNLNNSSQSPSASINGSSSSENAVINASDRESSPYKDIVLKSFVVFSRTCKKLADDGNSTLSFTAPANRYYVQPFVFLGKVNLTDNTVTEISTAQISITSGSTTLTLSKLSDFDYSIYRELGGLTQADHLNYTKNFYQGYFGAVGEMYTIDSFMYWHGDCANTPTFELGSDPGLTEVKLNVVDTANSLDQSYSIRPTVSASYTTYLSEGNPITDWTQCTYDLLTGNPMTYNGNSSTCKDFSLLSPPFVKLDSYLPSQIPNTTTTTASDPTRLIFYGHSYQKAFRQFVAENADSLSAQEAPTIPLVGCLNNGGIAGVPLKSDNSAIIPLKDFNVQTGDVVNLARRPGSYTGLVEFYQGDINVSGSITIPTCIPSGASGCSDYKNITVTTTNCKIKADSSIISTSISDSYVYPSYFEMSGTISN